MNYFLAFLNNLAKAFEKMEKYQIKLDTAKQREIERAQRVQLNQIKIEQASNKLVTSDLEIEIAKLKVLEIRRKMQLDAPEFKPENYD